MRATRQIAVIAAGFVLGTTPLAAAAQSLPPPPYQTADQAGGPSVQQSPQSIDRYGGGSSRAYTALRQPGAQTGPQQPSGPYLAWAGKTQMQAVPTPAAQSGGWSSMANRWDAEPQRSMQGRAQPQIQPQARAQTQAQPQAEQMGPPVGGWRPYHPQTAAAPPAPTSIYDAPTQAQAAPSPQPYRQAQPSPTSAANSQSGPRFYSLHREYGIQPDPIPLPPQFFGPTADLSATNAEPLAKRTTTINGQTKTVNVPDDQGAQ